MRPVIFALCTLALPSNLSADTLIGTWSCKHSAPDLPAAIDATMDFRPNDAVKVAANMHGTLPGGEVAILSMSARVFGV